MASDPRSRTEQELAALFASWDQRGNNGWEQANPVWGTYGDKTAFNSTLYDGGLMNDVSTAGMQYVPIYKDGDFDPATGWRTQTLDGFKSADGRYMANGGKSTNLNGTAYNEYGLDGKVRDTGTWEDISSTSAGAQMLQSIAFLASAYFGGQAAFGGQGGAVGGAGGFIGEGAASGIPAWDAAAAAAIPGEVGAAGVAGGFNAAADSQLANLGIEATGGDALAGYTGTGGVTASPVAGSGGLLSGGTGGTGNGLFGTDITAKQALGAASTLMGGASGGSGGGGNSTSTRTLDPRLDSAVFGNGGLVPGVQGLLGQSSSPEALARQKAMAAQASALLGTQARGNGFDLLTNNRYAPKAQGWN